MRTRIPCVLALLLLGTPAFAQDFFGSGKPPLFKEEDLDRRFARSRIGRMMNDGTENTDCLQVIGALFTVLSEVAPSLHKRDETFSVDPVLLQALQLQVTNPRFPGAAYLTAMVRRVQLDRKLPDAWLQTAAKINDRVQIIDVSKLAFLNDGLQLIDSYAFTLDALRAQHELQVKRATTMSTTSDREFRDRFLDREIAWNKLRLLDIVPETRSCPKSSFNPKKKNRVTSRRLSAGTSFVACLEPIPPKQDDDVMKFNVSMAKVLGAKPKPPSVLIRAKLADKQYIDLEKLPEGAPVLVRGRFWDMNKAVTDLEVREALLFVDRDWSQGAVLADPNAVARCPAAINELTGTASGVMQPGGFGRHP